MGKKNISLQKKDNSAELEQKKLTQRVVIGVVAGLLAILIGVAIVMTVFPDLGKDDQGSSSKTSQSEAEDNDNTVDIGDLAGDN